MQTAAGQRHSAQAGSEQDGSVQGTARLVLMFEEELMAELESYLFHKEF